MSDIRTKRRRHTKESLLYKKWRRSDPGTDLKKGDCGEDQEAER